MRTSSPQAPLATETASRISALLETRKLRVTASRRLILSLFLQEEMALSQPEIERMLHESCDRVTIYRNLSSFLEQGILHKVLDDEGAMKYALCPPACHPDHHAHHHNHVHFKCDRCGNTQCVNEVEIPTIALPSGYRLKDVNILLQGLCPNCTT